MHSLFSLFHSTKLWLFVPNHLEVACQFNNSSDKRLYSVELALHVTGLIQAL